MRQPTRPPVPRIRLTFPISYGRIICRDRFSIAARIGIAVASFVVIFSILLAYALYRRRRVARTNMSFVHASQNQQQVQPQYPPPQEGPFGPPPGGNGQKAQQGYEPQPYNGQYNPQYNEQYNPQYTGQYNPQYNTPQYPPAAYDQGNTVSAILISGFTAFHPRLVGAPVPWLWAAAWSSPSAARKRVENRFDMMSCTLVLPVLVLALLCRQCFRIHDDLNDVIHFVRDEEQRRAGKVKSLDEDRDCHGYARQCHVW